MARIRFEAERFHNTLGSHAPGVRVADGEAVIAETVDARGFDKHGVRRHTPPNPMTGPFFIEGAEPGDALAVRIDRMTANRDEGWTLGPVALNVVDPACSVASRVSKRALAALSA